MMILLTLSVLTGAVLGMRLRILSIIPPISIALIAIAAIGTVRGDALWFIISAMMLVAICLQFGYVMGSVSRFALAATRMPRRHTITTRTQSENEAVRVRF
jgi:hypothetical protein